MRCIYAESDHSIICRDEESCVVFYLVSLQQFNTETEAYKPPSSGQFLLIPVESLSTCDLSVSIGI